MQKHRIRTSGTNTTSGTSRSGVARRLELDSLSAIDVLSFACNLIVIEGIVDEGVVMIINYN